MWEFVIVNRKTGEPFKRNGIECDCIIGITFEKACKSVQIENPDEWEIVSMNYID